MTKRKVWLITGAGRGLGVEIAVERYGQIDVLVNNAGTFQLRLATFGTMKIIQAVGAKAAAKGLIIELLRKLPQEGQAHVDL